MKRGKVGRLGRLDGLGFGLIGLGLKDWKGGYMVDDCVGVVDYGIWESRFRAWFGLVWFGLVWLCEEGWGRCGRSIG